MALTSKGLSIRCRTDRVSGPRTASTDSVSSNPLPNEPVNKQNTAPTYSPAYLYHLNDNLQALGKCLTINYAKQHIGKEHGKIASLSAYSKYTVCHFFSSPRSNPFKITTGARKLTLMSSLWRLRGHPVAARAECCANNTNDRGKYSCERLAEKAPLPY